MVQCKQKESDAGWDNKTQLGCELAVTSQERDLGVMVVDSSMEVLTQWAAAVKKANSRLGIILIPDSKPSREEELQKKASSQRASEQSEQIGRANRSWTGGV